MPTQAAERLARLRELEQRSARNDEAILVIETPYRNQALLDAAMQALSPATRLLVASDLSLATQRIVVDTVAGWRAAARRLPRTPTVFGLQARPRRRAGARPTCARPLERLPGAP